MHILPACRGYCRVRQLPDLEWPRSREGPLHVLECESVRPLLRISAALFLTATSPPPPSLAEATSATPSLASQGEYLVIAGNCISCHSKPGRAPFAGGAQ